MRHRALPLRPDARRLIVYALFDRRGELEPAAELALTALRAHGDHLVVVVNGSLGADARERLSDLADTVFERENTGFDIEGHRHALSELGDAVASFDELVLTNDTWVGPVNDLATVFERMDVKAVDMWGMTDHDRVAPHPLTGRGVAPWHLQSYWIAVRGPLLRSREWARYWERLPRIRTYRDAVVLHETRFTRYFVSRGYRALAAFPTRRYATENPSLFEAARLLADGWPTLKRRPFFQWPPEMASRGAIGRWALDELNPQWRSVALADLVRDAQPRALHADAALLEVVDPSRQPLTPPPRIVVVAHIFYEDMTGEIFDHIDRLPGDPDVVVTTATADKASAIRAILEVRGPRRGSTEVRVVESNDGRDQSAFLITAEDVLRPGRYDLVVKLHSKRTPQDGFAVGRHFRHQQLSNLLDSPGHASAVIDLFARDPGLGIVFPPTIHIGYPTLGHGWWANRPGFDELSERLSIRVPADQITPLAPYGSMFVARPGALTPLTDHDWRFADFGGAQAYRDGSLAHVLERMPSYAAAEKGFHSRTVVTADYFAVTYSSLDYTFDELTRLLPGSVYERVELAGRGGPMGDLTLGDVLRMYSRFHPAKTAVARPVLPVARAVARLARRLRPS